MSRLAAFSVVVPAHNEQTVIGSCLAFVGNLHPGEAEVVVVVNGCRDRTAQVAAGVPGVRVVDLPAPGKPGALNAGDAAVAAFPRVYLDADVVVDAATLRRLVSRLAAPGPAVGAPRVAFDVTGRPLLVRCFYAVWRRLPYVDESMVGTGLYALNAEGRGRFGAFPEQLTADDLFVQRLFAPSEVRVLDDVAFTVRTPRDLRSLLAVRTRVAFGNAQLARTGRDGGGRSTTSTGRALLRLIGRRPWLAPAALVYVAVTVHSRLRARRSTAGIWQRDDSSRLPGPQGQP